MLQHRNTTGSVILKLAVNLDRVLLRKLCCGRIKIDQNYMVAFLERTCFDTRSAPYNTTRKKHLRQNAENIRSDAGYSARTKCRCHANNQKQNRSLKTLTSNRRWLASCPSTAFQISRGSGSSSLSLPRRASGSKPLRLGREAKSTTAGPRLLSRMKLEAELVVSKPKTEKPILVSEEKVTKDDPDTPPKA